MTKTVSEIPVAIWDIGYLAEGTASKTPFATLDIVPTVYLVHKDGSEQEVDFIYGPFQEESFGGKKIVYKEPMAIVRLIGVDIEKPWSVKTQPMRFLKYKYAPILKDEK